MLKRRIRAAKYQSIREGVAVMETAILLPILVVIVFAAMECSNALYLRQSLTIAAYESATILSESTGTYNDANAKCTEILSARNVNSHTLTVTPSVTSLLNPGDLITIEVTAPASAYSIGPAWFFKNKQLEATVYTVRAP
jgi:Flp pilus assembly protein TadG